MILMFGSLNIDLVARLAYDKAYPIGTQDLVKWSLLIVSGFPATCQVTEQPFCYRFSFAPETARPKRNKRDPTAPEAADPRGLSGAAAFARNTEMKPHVVCHMIASIDGKLSPSRWTKSPDGSRSEWSASYEKVHDGLSADAWIVGRVTMAEMAKGKPHPPAGKVAIERPHHFAAKDARPSAVALDSSGKLHFDGAGINGDHVVVLLGRDVSDEHLAELAGDGVSYRAAARLRGYSTALHEASIVPDPRLVREARFDIREGRILLDYFIGLPSRQRSSARRIYGRSA